MRALAKAQTVIGIRGFAAMLLSLAASPVLHAQGVSFQIISLGYAIQYAVLAIAEIPTGVWADIVGSKKSAIIGGILQVLSQVIFAYSGNDQFFILLGFFLVGLGTSFISGALPALMYGAATVEDGEKFNSNRYFSVTEKTAVASYVLASLSVGFLSEYFGAKSFLFSAALFLLATVFIANRFHELPKQREFRSLRKEFSARIAEGFSYIRQSLQLRVLLPIRMLHQVETILGVLWLPWIRELGGGDDRWFSVLATGSYALRYLVNQFFSKQKRPGSYMPRIAYSLACMALGSAICVFAENVWVAFFGVWTMAGARGAFLPAVQAIQHEEFPAKVQTTGLSVMNFSTEAMIALSYLVSASIVDRIDVSTAWAVSAVCFVISATIAIPAIRGAAVKSKENATKGEIEVVS